MPVLKLLLQFLPFPLPFQFLRLHFTAALCWSAVLPELPGGEVVPPELAVALPQHAQHSRTCWGRETAHTGLLWEKSRASGWCLHVLIQQPQKRAVSLYVFYSSILNQIFSVLFRVHDHSAMKVLHFSFEKSNMVIILKAEASVLITFWHFGISKAETQLFEKIN